MEEITKKAVMIITTFQNALNKGNIHMSEDGRCLTTVEEILKEMLSGKPITVI